MPRLTDKLLPLFLALLLGIAPLARAMGTEAGITTSQSMQMQQDGVHHDHAMATTNEACADCTTQYHCSNAGCGCYQCGSCGTTLSHAILHIPAHGQRPPLPVTQSASLSHHPFLLFRPPRA